jgi:trimeric autotransporter adhesin
MKQNPAPQSRILTPRVLVAFAPYFAGVSLALLPGNARGGDALDPASSQRPTDAYVTDGAVNAVARSGNTIYIGGGFSRVGPRTGPGLEFALNGTQNLGLPEVSGGDLGLQAVVSDGVDGWYIAGVFAHVGGVARSNIAHIRADHSVDPAFAPKVNGAVTSLVLSADGSTVYAVGYFTAVGGRLRNHIAALNAANGAVTAFDPNPNGTVVLALARSGSIIYAGGDFSTIGGQARNYIAALNASDGTATLTFNPNSSGQVRALAVSGSTLYAGGSFATIGGQPRSNIAALILGGAFDGTATGFDPDSSLFGCSPCGTIFALAVSSSTVYAGGTFDTIGGQPRNNLAGLDPTSGTATAFTPNPDSNIAGLAVSVDGLTVYTGGGFRNIGGQPRNFLAALNATDGSATTFNPNPNGLVASIGVSATAFYAAGFYSSIGGVVRHSLAAINASTGQATSFAPDSSYAGSGNGVVNALAVSVDSSTIYVGGFFTSFGGQPRNFIAALNTADGTATAWNPGIGTDYAVTSLALSDSVIYVGGYFQFIGGQPRKCLAAIGLIDGLATAFDANVFDIGASVDALAVSGPLVYAGGIFYHIGNQSRTCVAALNAADGSATAWNANLAWTAGTPQVHAITVSGSTIYVGGYFSSVGSQSRLNIAAVNAADGMATPFNPQASGAFASDPVDAIALSGSKVYAGGGFQTIGGRSRNLFAELNAADGSATSFNPGAGGGTSVFALAVAPDGTVYAGGDFHTFERAASQSFAVFANRSPHP